MPGQSLKLVLERLGRFNLHCCVMLPLPVDDFLSPKPIDLSGRFVEHRVRNDDGKDWIQKIIETLRSGQSDERRRVRNDERDFNGHCF